MQPDTDSGRDRALALPACRYKRKALEHRTAGGERLPRTLLAGISTPESGHHSVAGHMKHFATVCFSGARKDAEKLVKQGYDPSRRQFFGQTSVSSHIRE
jgi:hypothetical protein